MFSGQPGDWLVVGVGDAQSVVKHDIFCQTYVPVDEQAEYEMNQIGTGEV